MGRDPDVVVIGAGIVGLAFARALQHRRTDLAVTVVDKEPAVAQHQTGRNSGVVHAGLYYKPGSLKARLCVEGKARLREFCQERGVAYEACGKLVVALDEAEVPMLHAIHQRAIDNGVADLSLLDHVGLQDVEPHARGVLALHSPHTAIVDFQAVAQALADEVEGAGGIITTGAQVLDIHQTATRVRLETTTGPVATGHVVNCAGLYADRVARLAGDVRDPQLIPFRGEYYRLKPGRRDLVRGLIYPVPDPRYPFLGVHLTRRIDGEVLVGPNAVLAFGREGYRLTSVHAGELWETVASPGFRKMASQHWRTGIAEMTRSLSRRRFVEAARRYLPALTADDVIPGLAGVRGQAIEPDGTLVDDFRISRQGRVVSVRNAPSPAATSSLSIAELLVDRVLPDLR